MNPLRRPISSLPSRFSRPQQRRLASSDGITGRQDISSEHAESAGQAHPTSHGHHPEPVNETLGRGFYIAVAALPLSFAFYKYSRSSAGDPSDPASQPWLTRVIHSYDHWQDEYARRGVLHTAMVEQAAHDRHLFYGTKGSKVVDVGPEAFHAGSPFNVPAGSQANLDELMEFYKRQSREAQEKRERKAQAIYEGRESEFSRFPDGTKPIQDAATFFE